MPYSEDDMLMLSGIQHYAFCPRQWALIHIEQLWHDNILTTEGHIMHQHVDDPFYRQKMGDHISLRSVSLASSELGLYGVSDIVELRPSPIPENSITHPDYPGYWAPYPVEYKRGRPKSDEIDEVQLTAQAMCLEELYHISIPKGAIYYGEIRRRTEVLFTDELRSSVRYYASAMHQTFCDKAIPSSRYRACCRSCSLKDHCMPEKASGKSASEYLNLYLYAETS